MAGTSHAVAWLVLITIAFLGIGCGASTPGQFPAQDESEPAPEQGGEEPGAEPGGEPGAEPGPEPDPEGAMYWAESGCRLCHGETGSDGRAPNVHCYPADGLFAYLAPEDTPHLGAVWSDASPEAAAAVARYLDGGQCDSHVPASHTVAKGPHDVLHHPGLDTPDASCTACHGARLEGFGTVPSCASCHDGAGGTGCTSCHKSAQDNGDGVPTGGRRAVLGEFSMTSHHVTGTVSDEDCTVCHVMDRHRKGKLRLRDVDDSSRVFEVDGDPFSDSDVAEKLEGFCLACHDDDGADGSTPFSDDVTPTVIDATAWAASKHASAGLTCAGDGSSFGCHTSGHGTSNTSLLPARYVVEDPHVRKDGDYQLCWECHTKNTILFGDDAFDEYHKKHVIGEDTACAACHNVHGPYDSGEAGLIDFTRAWSKGWLTLPSGTTLSSAFWTVSGGGKCAIRCHGESHSPEGY